MTGVRDMIPGRSLAVRAGGPEGLEVRAGVATPEGLGASEGSRAQRPIIGVEVRGLLGG